IAQDSRSERRFGSHLGVLPELAVRDAVQRLHLTGLKVTRVALHVPEHFTRGGRELEVDERTRRGIADVLHLADDVEHARLVLDGPTGHSLVLADVERGPRLHV